jgi:alkylhydroperoxidase family enzyme
LRSERCAAGSRRSAPARSRARGDALWQDRRIAHLDLIDPDDATGLLAEEYEAAVGRAGRVYNIVRSMSLNPAVLHHSMQLYREVMYGPSSLSRQERELLATVVSATNECYY